MTTLLAVFSCSVLLSENIGWAFWLALIAGFFQFTSKLQMNEQYVANLHEGSTVKDSVASISNMTTNINIISSFAIYGFTIYAVFLLVF